ncbi:phosphonate ABC transporter ATP-binding protein [Cardiobacteriaceae bacterium TAE3-ERU3]|nr:phosphonate ABC transporter ATP-binding protein [Cardiobacteriaceae bacterium TAE3-ERU3]
MERATHTTAGAVAVRVENLVKSFNGKQVLDIPELTIHEGDMVALLGPSGSGKSTLMRHLSGLITGDSSSASRITVAGNTVQEKGRLSRRIRQQRCHIGLIFQQFNLVNRLTTLENVLVGALGSTPFWRTFFKRFTLQQKLKAMDALKRVGMADYAFQRVSTLSGGQQQRVAIARALMQGASVILADEPIASLDPESSRIVITILRDICKRDGITMVVTLHQVEHALAYCEKVVALQKGTIFYQGLSSELTPEYLERLYRIEREELNHDLPEAISEADEPTSLIKAQAKAYA